MLSTPKVKLSFSRTSLTISPMTWLVALLYATWSSVFAFGKNKTGREAVVRKKKARTVLFWKARGFQDRPQSKFPKNDCVVWKQRFANVKARKDFLFEQEDAFAGPGQITGCCAAAGATADDDCVEEIHVYTGIFAEECRT